jgi:PKD repeat protein
MKTKLFSLLNFLLFTTCLFAQEPQFEWAASFGGTDSDGGRSVTIDAAGNIYTTGNFRSTVDFDPENGVYELTSNGSSDIYISKLDASGNFMWAKSMGSISSDWGRSIAVDYAGNVYTTGQFESTVDFDPGNDTSIHTSNGNLDIFIQKLDANGNFVWAKTVGGISADVCNSIALDSAGNVYNTGIFMGTVDFDPGNDTSIHTSNGNYDIFIQKLDANGNFVWAKTIGGITTDVCNSIALDSAGNIYTTGYFVGTTDFDPGTGIYNLTINGDVDMFVLKLDANGSFIWAKCFGGNLWDEGKSITVDYNGNVLITGSFNGPVDFDPGSGIYNLTSNGSQDILILKLDSSGNLIWVKNVGGSSWEYGMSITSDVNGNVYTTGYFQSIADFDPGSGTYNLSSIGEGDIFISKFDAIGNFIWAKSIGGITWDNGTCIKVDELGNLYITGIFNGTIDFDAGSGTYNLTSNGSDDAFILKLSQASQIVNFYATDTIIAVSDTVQFNDLTTENPTSWLWDFGDGTTDTVQNPIHIYQNAGVYTVSLIVGNGFSTDTLVKQDYITVVDTVNYQTLILNTGWSIFSTYIQPEEMNIDSVFGMISQDIIIIKSGTGLVYWPEYFINNIVDMIVGQGYIVKMLNTHTFDIEGMIVIPENTPIPMATGWSIIGYLRQNSAPIEQIFSDIVLNIIIVKSGAGLVYWPEYFINNIGDMQPG